MPRSVFRRWKMSITSMLVRLSRLPVGSSANRMAGLLMRARAMATRCCCPPESWLGWWWARSLRPTSARASRARRCRSRARRPLPLYSSGSSTLSMALVRGSRLKPWKTNPTFLLRAVARVFFDRVETSCPSRMYRPDVGRSRQPRMCMNVDFPEPDGPITATNSPVPISSDTPRRARTLTSPRS